MVNPTLLQLLQKFGSEDGQASATCSICCSFGSETDLHMDKKMGQKVRMVRELKGFSQEYMAHALGMSQRGYSKLERDESKLDWERITQIAKLFEMEPMDLVSFDDNLVFHNCTQSGKIINSQLHNSQNEKLIAQYEERIKHLEADVAFLREELRARR